MLNGYPPEYAAPHKGIDDGSIFCSIVVATEKIVLTPQSQRPHAVLYEIIIYHVPAIGGVA